MNYKDLLIQVLKQIQGTKDARKQWCGLLVRIFIKTLKMKACTINKGVFIWMYKEKQFCILTLCTDNDLFFLKTREPFMIMLAEFKRYRKGSKLAFLNFRIIQSKHGITMDQSVHLKQTIIDPYFAGETLVKFGLSPFPLSTLFEWSLFCA
jgi:hypothetical protein